MPPTLLANTSQKYGMACEPTSYAILLTGVAKMTTDIVGRQWRAVWRGTNGKQPMPKAVYQSYLYDKHANCRS